VSAVAWQRGKTRQRSRVRLAARSSLVVPTHYDNFFSPVGRHRGLVRKVALADVPDEIHRVAADARVAALPRIDA